MRIDTQFIHICFLHPQQVKFRRYIGITLSAPLSVQIRVQPAIFFLYWHTIFGTWVYHHESMYSIYSWSQYDLDFWLQGQIYTRVFDMSLCLTHTFCFLWLWHIILGTWVYHNETMCHDIHDPNMTLTFYLKVKFIVFLKRLHVRATAFLSFDIIAPYLAHESLTMGQCVTYIQDLCMTLTFCLNIKIIFSPWICVWARSSLLFDIGIPKYHHETKCCCTFIIPHATSCGGHNVFDPFVRQSVLIFLSA